MNFNRPKNETETHFLLKEISKYILFGWGYTRLGTEVGDMHSDDLHIEGKDYKSIIDTVGVKKVTNKKVGSKRIVYYDVKGIEAKASLSDYKNGFCVAPYYTYIIVPINTIPINLLPDKIGFIEVDLDNFELKKWSQKIPDMNGVELVRKASKRIDSRFKSEDAYRKWCQETLEKVAYRSSSELLFWRNYIQFSG